MNSKLPTPHEIQQWIPSCLKDFVACGDAKTALVEHLMADGDGPNTLITGDTGTGKSTLVEAYVRTRNCPNVTDPLLGPCGTCNDCMTFSFESGDYGIPAICRDKAGAPGGRVTHFYHFNCGSSAELMGKIRGCR